MGENRLAMQNQFVAMYGSRCTLALDAYATGRDATAVIGVASEWRIVPDMTLRTLTREQVAAEYDGALPGVRSLLAQFNSHDPEREAILGVQFPDREVLTFVVQPRRVEHRARGALREDGK